MEPLKILSPLHRAIRQLDLYLEGETRKMGITNTEGHLLTYLLSYAPCPISDIHRIFGLKRSTLTSVLDRLEEREWIKRSPHPEDRRSLIITLKAKGKTQARKLRDLVEGVECKVLELVDQNRLDGFHHVMEAIAGVTGVDVRKP